MANEIRLDKKMFDALSSDTRRSILVGLNSHPLTVTALSKLVGIQKSAIYEHLKILMDVELVYKKESNNEFVYYDLTEKAKAIVNQSSNLAYKIYIMLTASIISLAGGLLEIIMFATKMLGISVPVLGGLPGTSTPIPTFKPLPSGVNPTTLPTPIVTLPSSQFFNVELIIGVCLIITGSILLYYSYRSIKANKIHRLSIPFTSR